MTPSTLTIKMNPRDPDLARIREVARGVREGKVVGFPTETVYGIGGPMSSRGLAEKLQEIKGRPQEKPFAYHIGEWEMIEYLKVSSTPAFRYLSRLFWPGPLTIIVNGEKGEAVGIRFPRNRLAAALINSTGEPFIATSANLSDEPSPRSAEDVRRSLEGRIDYLIDGGHTELGQDSTVVDLTHEHDPQMLREGAEAEPVREALEKIRSGDFPRRHILIVCTGNSCRSPMAEGWLRHELEMKGLAGKIEVSSCGVGARSGATATPEAVYVMKNRGVDITEHRSRPCTRQDVADADLVVAMAPQHAQFITSMMPAARGKVKVFNVMDPIGMSMQVYEDVARVIEKKMTDIWDEIVYLPEAVE